MSPSLVRCPLLSSLLYIRERRDERGEGGGRENQFTGEAEVMAGGEVIMHDYQPTAHYALLGLAG